MTDVANIAGENGMTVHRVVVADGFDHFVALRGAPGPDRRLHVYIEGDGIPWLGTHPTLDPTPGNPLALRLAARDPNPVAYVGRPCYFRDDAGDVRCHRRYWTSHRYGPEVVRSMASVIRKIGSDYDEIVLIGYSGGGSLAALLECEIDGVVAVVSVAANLDIDAWTRVHGYDPLVGSANPATVPRRSDIPHLQLIGGRDDVVPPDVSRGYADRQQGVALIEYPTFGHVCCWEAAWPAILEEFSSRVATIEAAGFR